MNGHPGIDTLEATEHLKNILNVGKADSDAARVSVSNGNMETSDVDVRFGNENTFQQVDLNENQEASISIYGTDVSVYSSPLHHGSRCSKIVIDTVVDYGWEHKYFPGRLLSIHLSRKYLAYALKAIMSSCGFVRVIKTNTNNHLLIRGLKGGAKDLSFAHSVSRVLLGCVDEIGQLFVYEIFDKASTLSFELCVHITRPADTSPSNYHRIMWCPYVPEDNDSLENNGNNDDASTSLLVVTHEEKAEIWNIDSVRKEYGPEVDSESVKTGLQLISEHKQAITAAAFSPDGVALATASLDGDVKFFQVNMQENESSPKCLHQWTPHEGKPLSSLFFLDNHKNYGPDVQFWKFAITGADNNQEIKLWSCETWSCLQTIRILPNLSDDVTPCLKANLDLSSAYLFLSDINRKVLYILQIHQEPATSQAFICSLSEFGVKYPVLSLAIVDVAMCKLKPSMCGKTSDNDEDDDDDDDDDDEDNDEDEKDEDIDNESDITERKRQAYLVKLFWIHTKSLQSCRIVYRPKTESPLQSVVSISSSQDSFVYRDGLSDLSADVQDSIDMNISEHDIASDKCIPSVGMSSGLAMTSASLTSTTLTPLPSHRTPSYKECVDILLTPEDFTSPSHSNLSSISAFNLSAVDESSPGLSVQEKLSKTDDIAAIPSESNTMSRRKSSQHSSTSSPSREVAEILAPNNILNSNQEIIDREQEINDTVTSQIKKDSEVLEDVLHPETVPRQSPGLVRKQQEYRTNEWPQAPDPNKEYKLASRSEGDISLQHPTREQPVLPRHTSKMSPQNEGASPEMKSTNTTTLLLKLERAVETLSHKLTTMTEALHQQREDIQEVQNEIQELQQQQNYIRSNVQNIDTLDNTISSKVGQIVSENAMLEYTRLEGLLNKRESNEKLRLEQQSATMSQNIVTGVNTRLENTVKQEIKTTVLPQMSKCLDTLADQMQGEILQKLNASDIALKESLGKHIKSKAFSDNLSHSAANLLQVQLQMTCKDVFQTTVVPAFEKSCQLLFTQLNDLFMRGTMDYLQQLERHRHVACSGFETAINKFQEQVHKLVGDSENAFNRNAIKEQEHRAEIAKQQDALIDKVKLTIQNEVHKIMKEQTASFAAIRSQAATPVPQNDSQLNPQQLVQLVKQGQLNEAFQQALSAVDLQLVLFLCDLVSPDAVFGPTPCPLPQHVLLSLIHQLSGDLALKTELKVRYIEDAITSLDSSSPVTREHIGSVLGSLQQRVVLFLKQNPNHKLTRSLKRVLLAVQSFVK